MSMGDADEYVYSQIMTIGGLGGTNGTLYMATVPFTGDEYEYTLVSVTSGDVAGAYLGIISSDQDIPSLPFDGSVGFGSIATAPTNFLKAQLVRIAPTQTVPPSDVWVRVINAGKYLFFRCFTPAASAMFIGVQFRFLPVKAIPGRATTVPAEAEHQHNIARSDRVIERLQMDEREGDKNDGRYRTGASGNSVTRRGRVVTGSYGDRD